MQDLQFFLFRVRSDVGDWLAAFHDSELVFLSSYNIGKQKVSKELSSFFEKHYHFKIGQFEVPDWSQGDFWKRKHKIKLQGSDFQLRVWSELIKIPWGTTTTYGHIAQRIRKPTAVRAVATAIANNPICVLIPCHRIVCKTGNKYKYRGGTKTKKELLQAEGIVIV
ncbi:MAG: MGMT family protein [Bdellovibrionaceae bacterium]|nr:MGMT family protein [Pseudobdellovibrionaceae bacterium]